MTSTSAKWWPWTVNVRDSASSTRTVHGRSVSTQTVADVSST